MVKSLAIVTAFYYPHVGGIERYTQEFARAAVDLGVSVNIVTTAAASHPSESIDEAGARVLRLPALNVPMMGSHYPIALAGWRRAAELLECDAVLAHTRFFMTSIVAAMLLARRGRSICILDHGAGPLRTSPRALALLASLYERGATTALKRLSANFFAVSDASARWLAEFGIAGAAILPNSVAESGPPRRREWTSTENITIFYAGRLLAEKGVLALAEAVDILAAGGRRVELRIAGEGPLSHALERRASSSESLTYLGRISPSQVQRELALASIFVHPSNLPEGLPTVLLEAGSAGLPVISTPFGGSSELIQSGHTGWGNFAR